MRLEQDLLRMSLQWRPRQRAAHGSALCREVKAAKRLGRQQKFQ